MSILNSLFLAIVIVVIHYIFEKERFKGRGIKVPILEIIVLTLVIFGISTVVTYVS